MHLDLHWLIEELADRIVAKLEAKTNGASAGAHRARSTARAPDAAKRKEQSMAAAATSREESPENTPYRVSIQAPQCLVVRCCGEVAAEVYCGDWAATLQKMGFRPPHKRRRPGDARVFVCWQHLADEALNTHLGHPRWQRLFDYL